MICFLALEIKKFRKCKFNPGKKSLSQQVLDGNCIEVPLRNLFIFSALDIRKISALTLKTNNSKS